jgi:hypothetical protein
MICKQFYDKEGVPEGDIEKVQAIETKIMKFISEITQILESEIDETLEKYRAKYCIVIPDKTIIAARKESKRVLARAK